MEKIINAILLVLVIVLAAFSGFMINQPAEIKEVPVVNTVIVIDNETSAKVDALADKVNSLNQFKVEADELLQNDTAKALVLEEFVKKSFKVALFDLLSEDFEIDSYKDLKFSALSIKEVELDGEEAVVTATFKVEFDNYNDEDFSKRLTIEVVSLVSGLDVEDMEDAEVESYEFEVLRVKDLD
jgi:hypothetical protein